MVTPRVRPARAPDEDRVVQLWCALAQQYSGFDPARYRWSPAAPDAWRQSFRDGLTRADVVLRVSVDAVDHPVGFMLARVVPLGPDYLERLAVHVQVLSVDPTHHREGHGRALLDALVEQAREHQWPRISLAVDGDNAAARAFYRALGMVERSVEMVLPLAPST